MDLLSGKKNVLWDFDGVVIDSSVIRDKGFTETLADFPKEQVEDLMKYHRANGGLSRYVKFKYFFEKIRKEKLSQKELSRYTDQFSQLMRKELLHEKYLIPETLDFLKRYHSDYNMHLVSGSDGEELRFLSKKLGITKYFITIEGSPVPKVDLLERLMKKYKYIPSESIYIGDSINDFHAADNNDIPFYGYNNDQLRNIGSGYINSFAE